MSLDTSIDNQAFDLYYASGTYIGYTSNHFVSGRKCMEFLWESGTGGYVVGFTSRSLDLQVFMIDNVHQLLWEKMVIE